MSEKSTDAFKSIGEVATELGIPQHVLRFWETRFPQVRPLKRGGGRRFYRPEDVALLHGIRFLLYAKGFTIKGVQRLLREQGVRFVAATASGDLRAEDSESDRPAPLTEPMTERSPERAVPDDLELTAPVASDETDDPPDGPRSSEAERRGGFSRFLKRGHETGSGGGAHLKPAQIETLQEVILDLLECKRILDQVR